jgi:hypothetical protein
VTGNRGTTRSQQIMAVARELAASGAGPSDIATRAHTSEQWAALALRVLREAPDLARAVSDGTMGLMPAYRALYKRKLAAPPPGQAQRIT